MSAKPGSPSQYKEKVYQLLINLLTSKQENPELVEVIGEEFINFILMNIDQGEDTSPDT